jgi:hypothetical protein
MHHLCIDSNREARVCSDASATRLFDRHLLSVRDFLYEYSLVVFSFYHPRIRHSCFINRRVGERTCERDNHIAATLTLLHLAIDYPSPAHRAVTPPTLKF